MNETPKKKILIVYSEHGTREALDLILSVAHDTIKIDSPAQAADVLAHAPSITLLLWDTRHLTPKGSETLLRLQSQYPGLKTVLIGGRQTKDGAALGNGLNVNGNITKPFVPEEVLAVIQQNIG
jgi:DNA-binding NtrC family response regulator